MLVSSSGRTASRVCLPFGVMTPTPWVDRVDLGARTAVWNTRHRPSVEVRASSRSSFRRKAATRGDLSEYAPVSFFLLVWVW